MVGVLDGHVQDVDGLFPEVLGEENKGRRSRTWGRSPLPLQLPARTLTLPSSSQYMDVWAFLKSGVSSATLAKQEMTSSKFLGTRDREGGLRGCSPMVTGQTQVPPFFQPPLCELVLSLARSKGSLMGSFPKGKDEPT